MTVAALYNHSRTCARKCHWISAFSGELETLYLALNLLSDDPHYSHGVTALRLTRACRAHLLEPILSGLYFYTTF